MCAEPSPEQNRQNWEGGKPDFMGVNAFDNIKAKLDAIVPQTEPQRPEPHYQEPEPAPQVPEPEERDPNAFYGDTSSYDYFLWKLKNELGEPPGMAAARERARLKEEEEEKEARYI